MGNKLLDANLLKKYHQDIVYNYAEYPTKDNWDYEFKDPDYKKMLDNWLSNNKKEPILFYVHTPFCEQLCYFCLCNKDITKNYDNVTNYLYNYLFKEIDLLFDFLNKKKIKLNVKEIYLGGGSPTYYKPKEFKALVDKMRSCFDFSDVGDFSIEIDPRRVDEERLLFYHECGVNRLSFGVQDFDLTVQERINRVQPPELFDKLLTKKVRDTFKTFNFDLLVGLPGQTNESIERTMNTVVDLKPPQIQPMLLHYKPFVRKYQIKMLNDGPLPDFFDRKNFFDIAKKKLTDAGYVRAGFESYVLPGDPIHEAMKNEQAYYNALGVQKGAATNFVSVGTSAQQSLGDDYYAQNFYSLNHYKDKLDENILPIFRGIKLNDDDKIRRAITGYIRTYFHVDFTKVENEFNINFKEYFSGELNNLSEFIADELVILSDNDIKITELGFNFAPQIANVFDKYNPPTHNAESRLAQIKEVAVHPS